MRSHKYDFLAVSHQSSTNFCDTEFQLFFAPSSKFEKTAFGFLPGLGQCGISFRRSDIGHVIDNYGTFYIDKCVLFMYGPVDQSSPLANFSTQTCSASTMVLLLAFILFMVSTYSSYGSLS